MQDFAVLRHITIGQYLPGDSFIHRLDARVKITLVIALIAALTVNTSYLANGLLSLLCLGLIGVAGLPLRYILGGVRPVAPVLIVLALFQILFFGDMAVTTTLPNVTIWRWGIFYVSTRSVQMAVVSLLRFMDLTVLVSLLTNATPMAQITYAIEDMLRPFARLGVPAHEISLVGAITLRFVPLLAEQMETIMKAQASRGARVAAGGRFSFIHIARSALVFVVPLFLDAFARAEDLIVAMEARCYTGGRGRTRLAQLQMRPSDIVVLVLATAGAACLILYARRLPF